MKKVRLDQLITELGLAPSRERAKAVIMAGEVFVDGQRVDKPGTPVDPEKQIEVRGASLPYVSRGGLKLEKALRVFSVDPSGKTCLDCGASTGGFTDVLLKNGARRVYARYLTRNDIPEEIDLAVMDLAFISVRLVIPAAAALLRDDGEIICLIKPQFEAGRENVGKKGVVRDEHVHLQVLRDFIDFVPSAGLTLMNLDYSPIKGPEGNIEYLALLKKGAHQATEPDAAAVVAASHGDLKDH